MSELRNLLKIATDEREALRSQIDALHQQMDPLDSLTVELTNEIVKGEKLLTKKPWRLYLHQGAGRHGGASTFGLICLGNWEDFPELRDLLRPDYHSTDYLVFHKMKNRRGEEYQDGVVDLHWSDGDMSLNFDSDEIARKFIRDFGIEVDISSLEEERANAQNTLDNVVETLAQVKATLTGETK